MAASLYVAIPTHSETITTFTAITLIELKGLLCARGMDAKIVFHSASVISDLRNVIVADFLASGAEILFMLDADQGIEAQAIWGMVETGYPVVGCIYPRRNFSWSQVPPNLSSGNMARILSHASRFVGQLEVQPDGRIEVHNGFARAVSVGGGMLLIRREALEAMKRRFPELKGQGFPEEDENRSRIDNNWGFFNPLVAARDGRNAGEDVGFCQRWRQCDGTIWANIENVTVHLGRYPYRGSYLDYLRNRGDVVVS